MKVSLGATGRQVGAWAGVIGPVLFTATFTIEGWLRPGYDPRSMFVSALSLGPRGGIQIINFIIGGALIALFAHGLAPEFNNGHAWRLGPTLLSIIGFSLLASGPFVMDPVTVPFMAMTRHSYLHYAFGILVFTLAPISCFVFFGRFRTDGRWQWLQWWTLAAGLIMTASVAALKAAMLPGPLHPYVGVVQRVALIDYLAWLECLALAVALKRRSRAL
jgi:Protein of unknown function (DUF998)